MHILRCAVLCGVLLRRTVLRGSGPRYPWNISEYLPPLPAPQVRHTEHRQWLRLLGRRADVQLWSPDPRRTALSDRHTRPYKGGLGLSGGEAWILPILEPIAAKHLAGVELFLPKDDQGKSGFAVLQGVSQRGGGGAAADGKVAGSTTSTLREVVVFRQPPSCQVYVVTSHGRRCLRQLAASSADSTSLAVIENRTGVPVMKARCCACARVSLCPCCALGVSF